MSFFNSWLRSRFRIKNTKSILTLFKIVKNKVVPIGIGMVFLMAFVPFVMNHEKGFPISWSGLGVDRAFASVETERETRGAWSFDRLSGPTVLNTSGRGLFANVLVSGETIWTTYQTATDQSTGPESLTGGKNLFWKTFDRSLNEITSEAVAIDVSSTLPVDWDGDLGDQKLVLLDGIIYMVAIVKNRNNLASVFKFDTNFQYIAGPSDFGVSNQSIEAHPDMGFGSDGTNLYAQFFFKNGDSPEDWGASIYKIDQNLQVETNTVVEPEAGSFVTGTAIIYVPAGQMGVTENRLQIFSTNKDFGNAARVGIHTFAVDTSLNLISGSRIDIVEEQLDTYFPTGPSWNEKHQIWVVGYTMENFEGEFGGGSGELGPSFMRMYDSNWKTLQTIQLNNNSSAFRVMTQTLDDDIYVVYDEMDKEGLVETSQAKIEHYRITSPEPIPAMGS